MNTIYHNVSLEQLNHRNPLSFPREPLRQIAADQEVELKYFLADMVERRKVRGLVAHSGNFPVIFPYSTCRFFIIFIIFVHAGYYSCEVCLAPGTKTRVLEDAANDVPGLPGVPDVHGLPGVPDEPGVPGGSGRRAKKAKKGRFVGGINWPPDKNTGYALRTQAQWEDVIG